MAVISGALARKETAAQHTNDLSVNYSGNTATGTHGHYNSGASCVDGCDACSGCY